MPNTSVYVTSCLWCSGWSSSGRDWSFSPSGQYHILVCVHMCSFNRPINCIREALMVSCRVKPERLDSVSGFWCHDDRTDMQSRSSDLHLKGDTHWSGSLLNAMKILDTISIKWSVPVLDSDWSADVFYSHFTQLFTA